MSRWAGSGSNSSRSARRSTAAPEETVLDAAFRQGYNLAYGCREGQCSACKCYLLEGEVDLKRYSNFALSDTERGNGYALMCRALPESDVVDRAAALRPRQLPAGERHPRRRRPTVEAVVELTHDIVGLTLAVPEDFSWLPGQYVDVHVPGRRRRAGARSRSPTCPASGRIELMIKRYPGGRFSALLGDADRRRFSSCGFTGPYGAFHLRRSERADPDDRRRLGDGPGARRAAPAGRRGLRAAGALLLRRARASATCSRWRRSRRSASGWPTSASPRSSAGSSTRRSTST